MNNFPLPSFNTKKISTQTSYLFNVIEFARFAWKDKIRIEG